MGLFNFCFGIFVLLQRRWDRKFVFPHTSIFDDSDLLMKGMTEVTRRNFASLRREVGEAYDPGCMIPCDGSLLHQRYKEGRESLFWLEDRAVA